MSCECAPLDHTNLFMVLAALVLSVLIVSVCITLCSLNSYDEEEQGDTHGSDG